MNKKVLVGSIISVVILILVTFTSVVGYRAVESNVKVSPLFTVRTSRAVNKESKDLSCDYVGKGEETNIHLSGRMKRVEQAQKAVDIISNMDDKAFSKFVARFILHLKYQEYLTRKEISEISHALYDTRNPNEMKNYNKNNFYDTFIITCEDTLEYLTCYNFLCILSSIAFIIQLILLSIAAWITSHTCVAVCNTWMCNI
ncbi:MAG: hypothetical protein JSW06_01390 [Thermoplasmatales archaeon]|nr:MAG: hypothetical protein JSW06_01390 [Thermoplasmatales archaeon]